MQIDQSGLDELERQLSHPYGEKAVEIAEMMHATNIGMTQATIAALGLQQGQQVLELGHGNGAHIAYLLEQAPELHYTGLDVSEAMLREASRLNVPAVDSGRARFHLYDGEVIPFDDASFDRIFGVNTIYFWRDPQALLGELHRVLRPNGLLAITFAQKSFMLTLPFVRDRFRLYDDSDFTELVRSSAFHLGPLTTITEEVRSKTGELIERDFTVGLLRK